MVFCCTSKAFRREPIRNQLLVLYGGLVGFSFLIVLVICLLSVSTLRDTVLEDCEAALRDQIQGNCGYILAETADFFETKIDVGLRGLALPAAFAIHDASRPPTGGRGYSAVAANVSYADSSVSTLSPPLSTDIRYQCLAAESDALKTRRGCPVPAPSGGGLRGISR